MPGSVRPVRGLPAIAALLSSLALLAAGCGDDDSAAPSGAGVYADAETARVPLASTADPAGAEGYTLTVSDVTIAAGDVLDPHFHDGTQTAHIDSGVLTYSVIEGAVPVMTGSPEDDPELVTEIKAGETAEIEPGQWVVEERGDVHMAENEGDVPVEITLTALLRDGAEASTPAE